MSDAWTERISSYLDGEMSVIEKGAFEEHLEACGGCCEILDDLKAISDTASSLEELSPPPTLWNSIRSSIEEEQNQLKPQAQTSRQQTQTPKKIRSLQFSMGELLAAAIALILLSAGGGWMLGQETSNTSSPVPIAQNENEPSIRVANSLPEPSKGGLVESLQKLEAELLERQGSLDEETMTRIQDSLFFIDSSISDARRALLVDPESEYLNAHLNKSLQKKVRVLQGATRLASNEI